MNRLTQISLSALRAVLARVFSSTKILLPLLLVLTTTSCSIGFVSQSAYNYFGVLWRSEKIEAVLKGGSTDALTKEKLGLILEARKFARQIGLTVNHNYSKFATVSSDSLAWVVTASRRTAFEPYTWWYPFVGSLPYKGYFWKKDADALSTELQESGYETGVRDTVAFSTLGWFPDPVLSSITQLAPEQIIETILHELTHTTVWVSSAVDFNESLANFVGLTAAAEFFQIPSSMAYSWDEASIRNNAARNKAGALLFSDYIESLISALTELYDRKLSEDETLTQRQAVLENINRQYRDTFSNKQVFSTVNNAVLIGTSLYYKNLSGFEALFDKSGRNWARFLDCIREIANTHSNDPFAALKEDTYCHETIR